MATIREMAEAHLRNVDQQITMLVNQRAKIEEEIRTLQQYLQKGVEELNNTEGVKEKEAGWVNDTPDGAYLGTTPSPMNMIF